MCFIYIVLFAALKFSYIISDKEPITSSASTVATEKVFVGVKKRSTTEKVSRPKYKTMYMKKDAYSYKKPSRKSKRSRLFINERVRVASYNDTWYITKSGKYIHKSVLSNKKKQYKSKACPSNSFKSFMPYTAIGGGKQYRFQKKCYTGDYGLRMYKGRYCIALGSYYTTKIGKKVDLITTKGKVIRCIIGDCKANKDTNTSNQKHLSDGSVVEFLVDYKSLDSSIMLHGDVSAIGGKFNQGIKCIVIY